MQSSTFQAQGMGYDPDMPCGIDGLSLSLAVFGLAQFSEGFWVADREQLCPLALSVLVINCLTGGCPHLTWISAQGKKPPHLLNI